MNKAQAAFEALRASDKLMLTPAEVAPVLGCDPYAINIQAREDPSRLGFPVVVLRSRVKIPRIPFLAWLGGAQHVDITKGDDDPC